MTKLERGRGARALAALLPKLAAPVLRKRGFNEATLVTRWPDIVGASLARDAAPDRLAFPRGRNDGATLHVRVAGPAAIEVQHLAPEILDRINTFFGYAAVARLSLIQGPVVPPVPSPQAKPRAAVPPAREAAIESAAARIADSGLKQALTALGRAIASDRGR